MSVKDLFELVKNPIETVQKAAISELLKQIITERKKVDTILHADIIDYLSKYKCSDEDMRTKVNTILDYLSVIPIWIKKMSTESDSEEPLFVRMSLNQPVAVLKLHIEALKSIPVEEQMLIFAGQKLDNDKLLSTYSIVPDSSIIIILKRDQRPEIEQWHEHRERYRKYKNIESPYEKIKSMGYRINSDLQVRSLSTNSLYKWVNQEHYEKIGDCICDVVEDYLILVLGLMRHRIPILVEGDEPTAGILMSRGALDKSQLVVFIPVIGTTKSGMWVRGVCVNDDLYKGTFIDIIQYSLERDVGVVVLNPNETRDKEFNVQVSCNKSPIEHVLYCYDNFIKKSVSNNITLACHQTGGDCGIHLLKCRKELIPKIKKIIFVDSTHNLIECEQDVIHCIQTNGIGWQTDGATKGTFLQPLVTKYGCSIYASGETKNTVTPWAIKDELLNQFPKNNPSIEGDISRREKYWISRRIVV